MSNVELLSGEAAAGASDDNLLSGTLSPRKYRVDESLSGRANTLMSSAFAGDWGADVKLAEAFSTSDFKLAAFKELDSEMLAQYAELPSVWEQYTDQTTVNDFRPKRLKSRWRNTVGMARVPELNEYPADTGQGFAEYAIQVAKYGRRFAISWEAWKNNEAVQELEDLPGELARQARETEMIAAASNLLKVDPATAIASDVNTAFFKTGNGNAPTNVPLTRENLRAVLDAMRVRKDSQSKRSIAAPELVLVVPKSLESAVLRIVTPTLVRRTDADGTITEEGNEFNTLSYVVDPMLDYLNGHRNAATTWFVLPKPGSARPALWTAKLRGHEQPDLRVKADTGARIGGGAISALDGSFDVDDIQYRGRHIVGNQAADPLFTYASYGA